MSIKTALILLLLSTTIVATSSCGKTFDLNIGSVTSKQELSDKRNNQLSRFTITENNNPHAAKLLIKKNSSGEIVIQNQHYKKNDYRSERMSFFSTNFYQIIASPTQQYIFRSNTVFNRDVTATGLYADMRQVTIKKNGYNIYGGQY